MFKEFSLGCLVVGSSLIWKKKRKINRNGHSLSRVVTRCTTRCHSLSLVVALVVTCCHSLSLDVPLVCLFINDQDLRHWNYLNVSHFERQMLESTGWVAHYVCHLVCSDRTIIHASSNSALVWGKLL